MELAIDLANFNVAKSKAELPRYAEGKPAKQCPNDRRISPAHVVSSTMQSPPELSILYFNYRFLQKGPETLESICEDVLALTAKLRLVDETCVTLSTLDEQNLEGIKGGCNAVLLELEGLLARCRANHGALEPITDVQREVLERENDLNSFLETLRSHSQVKLLTVLDQIHETKSGEFQRAIVTDWEVLEAELHKLGLAKELIEEEFFFIESWLKENYPPEVPEEEAEALTGYTPGAQRGTIEEKVQALQQTTMVVREAPVEPTVSSSKAEPPPYTFEEGADEFLDDNFSQYINAAIRAEADIRALQRLDDSELSAHPWSWLPPSIRNKFSAMGGVVPKLPPESFSVMAYETCPRLSAHVERLKRLLNTSFEENPAVPNPAHHEAFRSLKAMSEAIKKFPLLQDQGASLSRLSDLDILDYEASTAMAADLALGFPIEEIELAQKGYYRLLTYMMGFVNAFASIYTGRTYVTSSSSDIEFAWKALKMNSRTAWVEKQLVGWSPIQNAALYCRDFRRNNPGLRSQAIKALQDWEIAEKILSGKDAESIDVKVISASSLLKTSFRAPNAWVKIVFYGANKFGGAYRKLELKTEAVQKNQDRVWNQTFKLDIPGDARMIDLEVYDRVGGIHKQLSRVRLKFSTVPGVDASLANRSLIYGLDEELDFPLQIIDGKGKEKVQPVLRVGLKWDGRMGRVQRLGLPMRPPGKMFRPDVGIIPLPDPQDAPLGAVPTATSIPNLKS